MLRLIVSYLKNNKKKEIDLPGMYVVCSKCAGHGKYLDDTLSSIDDDSYIICVKCKGVRVVPEIDMNNISLEETSSMLEVGRVMLKSNKGNKLLHIRPKYGL